MPVAGDVRQHPGSIGQWLDDYLIFPFIFLDLLSLLSHFFPPISPLIFIQFWTPQTSLQRGPDRPDRLPTSRSPKKPPTVSLKEPVRVKKPLVPRTERRFLACAVFFPSTNGVWKLVTIKWGI